MSTTDASEQIAAATLTPERIKEAADSFLCEVGPCGHVWGISTLWSAGVLDDKHPDSTIVALPSEEARAFWKGPFENCLTCAAVCFGGEETHEGGGQ